jgi:hypothetical protein
MGHSEGSWSQPCHLRPISNSTTAYTVNQNEKLSMDSTLNKRQFYCKLMIPYEESVPFRDDFNWK